MKSRKSELKSNISSTTQEKLELSRRNEGLFLSLFLIRSWYVEHQKAAESVQKLRERISFLNVSIQTYEKAITTPLTQSIEEVSESRSFSMSDVLVDWSS